MSTSLLALPASQDTGDSPDSISAAARLLSAAQRVLLCSHRKPDGDAIGSLLGLGQALEAAGKTVAMACQDPAAGSLARLPGAERIVCDLGSFYTPATLASPAGAPWDLAVVMDASSLDRLGTLYEANSALFASLPLLNIDHHITNTRFGATNLVDARAASTTELVTLVLDQMGVTITVPAATCLMAGLITDSLSFQTESTAPRTLHVAARLLEAGAPLSKLAFALFRQRPLSNSLLWSACLGSLQFAAGGKLAWIEIPLSARIAAGPDADSSGLSGWAGSVTGVQVGMTIEEADDGNVYVSLRSQTVDVAALAAKFGGGGHVRAAGCHFSAPTSLEASRQQLIPVAEAYLAAPQSESIAAG